MIAPPATDWLGRIIDGRYVVEAVVGRGGMGVVLAARHKFTGARVAVKMVRTDLGLDAAIEARFLAEARVPTAIEHRGVVKTLDAGKTAEGELYIVMELLTGRSLREQMTSGLGGPTTRRIGMELLDVLAAAHARGIVHRDVKPENVFLVEPELSVKLLDFGITKVLAGSASVLPRTAAGALLGTLEYMAPEQLADARGVDARADLWAVSVIMYEMLSGRRPYRATTVEEMFVALVSGEPDPIRIAMPSATPEVEAFFARALARDPQQRFATASEMAMAFAKLPVRAAAPAPVGRPAGANVTLATGAGAGTLATGFGAAPATLATGFGAAPATLATGFGAAATPDRGMPGVAVPRAQPATAPVAPITPPSEPPSGVLTPFAGTPALVGAMPAFAAPPSTAPRAWPSGAQALPGHRIPGGPPTPSSAAQALPNPWGPATPSTGAQALPNPWGPAAPSTGAQALPNHWIPATPASPSTGAQVIALAASTATASPPARRWLAWVLGGIAAVALGAVTVVAIGGARPPAAPAPPLASRGATAGPAATAAPPAPTSPPTAAPPATPARPPRPTPPARPSSRTRSSDSPRSAGAQPARRSGDPPAATPPLDPYAGTAAQPPHERGAPPGLTEPTRPVAAAAPPPSPVDTCAAGCKLLASCHLGSQTCEAECAQRGTLGTCLQQAAGDCNRFAACWFATSCGGITPRGQHTCSAAMDCETTCNGDTTCLCGCVAGLASHHAAALLGYNGCALPCRGDADCIARRCGPQARWCRAE